jgi:hypothetical protein
VAFWAVGVMAGESGTIPQRESATGFRAPSGTAVRQVTTHQNSHKGRGTWAAVVGSSRGQQETILLVVRMRPRLL